MTTSNNGCSVELEPADLRNASNMGVAPSSLLSLPDLYDATIFELLEGLAKGTFTSEQLVSVSIDSLFTACTPVYVTPVR